MNRDNYIGSIKTKSGNAVSCTYLYKCVEVREPRYLFITAGPCLIPIFSCILTPSNKHTHTREIIHTHSIILSPTYNEPEFKDIRLADESRRDLDLILTNNTNSPVHLPQKTQTHTHTPIHQTFFTQLLSHKKME